MSGHASWTAALRQHLDYVQREGVALGGEAGQLYSRDATGVAPSGFLGRSADDARQFRVIVSAERGVDLDLTTFTRTFLGQVEADVGTRLDWVAVNHYDTDHPHTHVLVRGTDADGQPLALQRHYLTQGLRYRAQEIATRELGPRVERDVPHEVVPERTVASAPPLRRDRGLDLDF
jgi:type IV secretory pathway VirD2 relaxase